MKYDVDPDSRVRLPSHRHHLVQVAVLGWRSSGEITGLARSCGDSVVHWIGRRRS